MPCFLPWISICHQIWFFLACAVFRGLRIKPVWNLLKLYCLYVILWSSDTSLVWSVTVLDTFPTLIHPNTCLTFLIRCLIQKLLFCWLEHSGVTFTQLILLKKHKRLVWKDEYIINLNILLYVTYISFN